MYLELWLTMALSFVAGALTATACLLWGAFTIAGYQRRVGQQKQSAGL